MSSTRVRSRFPERNRHSGPAAAHSSITSRTTLNTAPHGGLRKNRPSPAARVRCLGLCSARCGSSDLPAVAGRVKIDRARHAIPHRECTAACSAPSSHGRAGRRTVTHSTLPALSSILSVTMITELHARLAIEHTAFATPQIEHFPISAVNGCTGRSPLPRQRTEAVCSGFTRLVIARAQIRGPAAVPMAGPDLRLVLLHIPRAFLPAGQHGVFRSVTTSFL